MSVVDRRIAALPRSRLRPRLTIRASPWPPPEQIAARPMPPPRRCSSLISVSVIRAPLAPIGWPRATAPPLTLTLSGIDAEAPGGDDGDAGERLVDLDQIDVVDGQSRPSEGDPAGHLRRVGQVRRVPGGDALGQDRRQGRDPVLLRPPRARDHERRRAVVDAGRVAGRDGAVRSRRPASASPAPPGWCRGAAPRRCRRSSCLCAPGSRPGRSPRPSPRAPWRRCRVWWERSAQASCSSRETPTSWRRRCRRGCPSGRRRRRRAGRR